MPIEAVKIPQNVYVEDRIIGPVTLKQLLIVGIGAGISYIIYSMVVRAGYKDIPIQVICWVPALIAAMFAFLKVNDLSLFNIILLMIEGFNKPSQRYWSSHPGISINLITRQNMKELETAQAKATETASRLAEMTQQMEKRQAEMNALSLHEMPRPQDTNPVRTLMRDIVAREQPTEQPVEVHSADNDRGSSLPVNRSRVTTSAFDPARSVDGICSDIRTFTDVSPLHS